MAGGDFGEVVVPASFGLGVGGALWLGGEVGWEGEGVWEVDVVQDWAGDVEFEF